MERSIFINLVYLALILPFIYVAVDKSQSQWKKSMGLFIIYFLLYKISLFLPAYVPWLKMENLNWNWPGKVVAILFSLLFYHAFKNHFSEHLFINASPVKKQINRQLIIVSLISAVAILEGLLFYNQPWDTETILFQLTLPGIDEEIAYRGIMLGLLASFMTAKITFGKITIHDPSIWIVGILFGLIHALQFDKTWHLNFDLLYFIKTFALGTIWSYMTIKTRSILLPVLSHNLSNTLANLIGMIK